MSASNGKTTESNNLHKHLLKNTLNRLYSHASKNTSRHNAESTIQARYLLKQHYGEKL